MDIQGTNAATNSTTSDTTAVRSATSELDKDAFMQILVTQLKNQDPLSPMDNTDFIAQMAQFSVLEELQSLNTSFSFGQASGLVGKSVYATVTADDGTETVTCGKVTSVMTSGGVPFLEVNGKYIPYSTDLVVYDYTDTTANSTGNSTIPDSTSTQEV